MPLSEWLGKAKIDFYHAATPRSIKQKDGTDRNLLKICEDSTPPCYLNPLLGSGHLQTMWTATKPEGPSIYYRRKVFNAEQEAYHGTFAVDFVVKPFEESDPTLSNRTVYFTDNQFARLKSEDSKPMLVVLHGLSGGSHEVYLRHTIAPLVDSGNWEICIVNSRGCAKSKITSGILYNARATWDIRQVVRWLRKTFPNRPLFGLGFSLGANMLTNVSGCTSLTMGFFVDDGSTVARKAPIASSKQPSSVRTPSTWRSPASCFKILSLEEKSTSATWVVSSPRHPVCSDCVACLRIV